MRRLAAQVLVRLTREQHMAVVAQAQAAQVSLASWIRRVIADAIGVEPGPVTTRAMPPHVILEIAHLREVVAELGGALVKAAITARQDGRPAEHAAIEALIPGVKAAVRNLDKLKETLWRPAA
jgi:hypothetical protein